MLAVKGLFGLRPLTTFPRATALNLAPHASQLRPFIDSINIDNLEKFDNNDDRITNSMIINIIIAK